MPRTLLALVILCSSFISFSAFAKTAICSGRVNRASLYFEARGSLMKKRDGSGFVKINNRVVAEFDGDAARINYFKKTFSIRNDRGDIISGKLNNLSTGASTLTQMVLPGEGVTLSNVPVRCSVR